MTVATDCIVFGVLLGDGHEDWPGRNRLLESLAKDHVVVFLEGSRSGSALLAPVTIVASRSHPEVLVATNALALTSNRWTRRMGGLARTIDRLRLRRALAARGLSSPLLWLTTPDPSIWQTVPHLRAIFDCMDPCFEPERQAQFDRDEAWVVARSTMVFASAWSLQRRMSRIHDDVVLLPNAADPEDLRRFSEPRGDVDAGRPRVGYLGTLDWRFDGDLVVAVAQSMPEVDFVLGGRVNDPGAAYVHGLRRLPNVSLLGQIGVAEGRDLVSGLDVGIIPFVPGETNDAINPVKLYMYLAYGKPVVATDVEECRRNDLVRTARDPAEFVDHLRGALRDDPRTVERHRFAAENSWSMRADEAQAELESRGLLS